MKKEQRHSQGLITTIIHCLVLFVILWGNIGVKKALADMLLQNGGNTINYCMKSTSSKCTVFPNYSICIKSLTLNSNNTTLSAIFSIKDKGDTYSHGYKIPIVITVSSLSGDLIFHEWKQKLSEFDLIEINKVELSTGGLGEYTYKTSDSKPLSTGNYTISCSLASPILGESYENCPLTVSYDFTIPKPPSSSTPPSTSTPSKPTVPEPEPEIEDEPNPPVITLEEARSCSGNYIILQGKDFNSEHKYTVTVDWKDNDPGKVYYSINNKNLVEATKKNNTNYTLNINADMLDNNENEINISAIASNGIIGNYTAIFNLTSIPWANSFSSESNVIQSGYNDEKKAYQFSWDYSPEWVQPITIYKDIPYLGGKMYGIKDFNASLDILLYSCDKTDGRLSIAGGAALTIGDDNKIGGKLSGDGNISYFGGEFNLTPAQTVIDINSEFKKEWPVSELIPGLNAYSIDQIKWINDTAKITVKIASGMKLNLVLQEIEEKGEDGSKEEKIRFTEANGALKVGLAGLLNLGRGQLELKAGVHGDITTKCKYPYEEFKKFIDNLTLKLSIDGQITCWSLILKDNKSYSATLSNGVWRFEEFDEFGANGIGVRQKSGSGIDKIDLNHPRFRAILPEDFLTDKNQADVGDQIRSRTGNYSSPLSRGDTILSEIDPHLYPHPEPTIVEVDGKSMLCFTSYEKNTDNPLQCTDIYFMTFEEGIWSEAAPVFDDDAHGDFSPKLAVDKNGKIILVWQRINNTRLNDTYLSKFIDNADNKRNELEVMASYMEIVYATYDWNSERKWEGPFIITNNNYLDTNPLLTTDINGNVFLFWESNEKNRLIGSPDSPSKLHLVKWDNSEWKTLAPPMDNQDNSFDYSLAAGDNEIIILWTGYDKTDQDRYHLKYIKCTGSNSWGEATEWKQAKARTQEVSDYLGKVIADREGNFYITWIQEAEKLLSTIEIQEGKEVLV
ncbi:MAG: hypothetical protein V1872_07415, partial [bacterium]